MNNLKKRLRLRKKKRLLNFIEESRSCEETSIKYKVKTESLYNNLLEESIRQAYTLDSKIPRWIRNLSGLSGRKYRYLINNLVENFPNPKYLEIGSWIGSTSCSASYKNKLKIACVDNWSETFENIKKPKDLFLLNINKCLEKETEFKLYEIDFRHLNYKTIGKFNILFVDGPHHKEDHYDVIKISQDALENEYVLIVDDWNWKQVREGTFEAIRDLGLNVKSNIEIKTTQDDLRPLFEGKFTDWHNGYSFFVLKK